MAVIEVSNPIAGGTGEVIQSQAVGSPAVGAPTVVHAAVTDNGSAPVINSIHAAVTDNGSEQIITTGITQPVAAPRTISATSGGTGADIGAIQVIITGTDANDAPLTETLPIFTANTPTTVTGAQLFKTVTSIDIPAHDGTGATTAIGVGIKLGTTQTVTTGITNPDVPRNLTATSGGTSGDIKAVSVTVTGTDINGQVITEVLPVFTVNTATTVVGVKAFKTVTSISIPGMDGNGATVAIGTGAKLGLNTRLSRNTVVAAYFNGVKEATAPTVVFDATNLYGNMATLNTTLDGSAVVIDFYDS